MTTRRENASITPVRVRRPRRKNFKFRYTVDEMVNDPTLFQHELMRLSVDILQGKAPDAERIRSFQAIVREMRGVAEQRDKEKEIKRVMELARQVIAHAANGAITEDKVNDLIRRIKSEQPES